MSEDKTYRVDLKKGDLTAQFTDIFQDIFARHTAAAVKQRINKAVDREMGKVFQRIAIDIYNNDFADIDPYIPGGGWQEYSENYARRKQSKVGHLDWFKYGHRVNKKGEVVRSDPQLLTELFAITPSRVLNRIGETYTTISKDKKRIKISIAPDVQVTASRMERQFGDLIDDRQMRKLRNRRRAYRSLIGPEFVFMLSERIPQLVQRSLARF